MEAGPSTPGLSNSNLNAIQAQVQDVGSSTSAYHQLTLNSTSSSSLPADPLSALEDLLDMLLKISAASYSFISRKSSHKQINPQVPIWIQGQAKESSSEAARLKLGLLDDQGMQENIDELVADLIENSKEAERIIKNLPDGLVGGGEEGEEKHEEELKGLEAEVREANQEYREALQEAKELQSQVASLLREVTSHQQVMRTQLAAEYPSPETTSRSVSSKQQTGTNSRASKRIRGS